MLRWRTLNNSMTKPKSMKIQLAPKLKKNVNYWPVRKQLKLVWKMHETLSIFRSSITFISLYFTLAFN